MAGRALGSMVDVNPEGASTLVLAGDDALLALAGGCPVGVEGGALFLPFLGGVVDIRGDKNLAFSDWLKTTSQIGR